MQKPPLILLLLGALAALYYWAVFISTFHFPGTIGLNYNAPGADYMVFNTAVRLAIHNDLRTLYDGDRFTEALNQHFQTYLSKPLEFRPWIYPPPFLLLLLPFALTGFYASYALFQAFTAAALASSLRTGELHRPGWICCAALLCPAASVSVVSGQICFLIAALLIAGAGLMDRRPILSGVLFGLLAIKPQFYLLVPILLVTRRAWGASAAALVTIFLMAAATAALFGFQIWTGWFAVIARSTSGTDPRWLLYGRIWGESVYTCAFLSGAGPRLAATLQWLATLLAAGCVWYSFRRPMAFALRAAILLAAALLAAPHSGGYDLLLLATASALLLSHLGPSASKFDWWLGFLAWIWPLFSLPVQTFMGRSVPVLTLTLLLRILWQARDHAAAIEPQ